MRHTKMAEWMENVEKSISRIMADRVYTSAEFKRERDNFHVRFFSHFSLLHGQFPKNVQTQTHLCFDFICFLCMTKFRLSGFVQGFGAC